MVKEQTTNHDKVIYIDTNIGAIVWIMIKDRTTIGRDPRILISILGSYLKISYGPTLLYKHVVTYDLNIADPTDIIWHITGCIDEYKPSN